MGAAVPAPHESKDLHFAPRFVSGREFTRATNRPPIFLKIKYAAKPRSNLVPTKCHLGEAPEIRGASRVSDELRRKVR
jgi:hypothetical protein